MKFYGKYRGSVVNNIDPQRMARLQVRVPTVLGSTRFSWAMPCVPYAGRGVGWFALPPIGANIWVEFEGGDPDYPIWSGCYWGIGELPTAALLPTVKVFQTDSITLKLDDTPGIGGVKIATTAPATSTPMKLDLTSMGINFETKPAKMKLSVTGIEISNGVAAIKLSGPSVNINSGALEII